VLLVAGPTLYALMGGSGSTLAAAVEYSNAIFAGSLAYRVLSTLTSVVRGTGRATVLAVVYIAAETLHVLLVPTMVFGIGPIRGPRDYRRRHCDGDLVHCLYADARLVPGVRANRGHLLAAGRPAQLASIPRNPAGGGLRCRCSPCSTT
jgi:hypothetical protein